MNIFVAEAAEVRELKKKVKKWKNEGYVPQGKVLVNVSDGKTVYSQLMTRN